MKNFLILMFLFYLSCDITENRFITINNKSNSSIYGFITTKDILPGEVNTPNDISIEIEKGNFNTINPVRIKWEEYIKKCDNQKIRLYLISKDSVDKYGWNEIYKKDNYLKKYLFSIDNLDKINWEVTYKP